MSGEDSASSDVFYQMRFFQFFLEKHAEMLYNKTDDIKPMSTGIENERRLETKTP